MPSKRKKPSQETTPAKEGRGAEGAGKEAGGGDDALTFEDAIEEVEEIVREMESDRIPLESLLRGMVLL